MYSARNVYYRFSILAVNWHTFFNAKRGSTLVYNFPFRSMFRPYPPAGELYSYKKIRQIDLRGKLSSCGIICWISLNLNFAKNCY